MSSWLVQRQVYGLKVFRTLWQLCMKPSLVEQSACCATSREGEPLQRSLLIHLTDWTYGERTVKQKYPIHKENSRSPDFGNCWCPLCRSCKARSQNCEKQLLASLCLSARQILLPHRTIRLPLNGFLWNLILELLFFGNLSRKLKFH